MNRACSFGLALAFMAIVDAAKVQAQDQAPKIRPVAVAAFSGYAELQRDLEYLGKLAEHPEAAAQLEKLISLLTRGGGLAGVDPDRPWGAWLSISADGFQFSMVTFAPVADYDRLLAAVTASLGDAADAGGGVREFKRAGQSYFLAQQGRWAYLSQQKNALTALPADPLELLEGLDKQYDLAISVNVQNIPQVLRGAATAIIHRHLAARLPERSDDAEKRQSQQAQIARQRIESAVEDLGQLDRLVAGLNIDRVQGRSRLELEITALAESDAARLFAASEERKASQLGGAMAPEAILSLHLNSSLTADEREAARAWLSGLRERVLAELDDEPLDDEPKSQVKEVLEKLADLLGETIEKERRVNFGMFAARRNSDDEFGDLINDAILESLPGNYVHETIVGAGEIKLVAGGVVADGFKLEDAVKQIVALVRKDVELPELQLNVAEHRGRRFHAISIPLPHTMRAEWPLRTLRNLLGNPMKVAVAFGDDTFYVAVGEQNIDAIQRLIDASAEPAAEHLPPATVSLALARVWSLAAWQNRKPAARKLAARLQEGGKDRLTFAIEPVDRGMRCRLEGQDGFNLLLGVASASAIHSVARLNGIRD